MARRKWHELRDELLTTPEAREAYEKAQAEISKQIQGLCKYGFCVEYRDPDTGEYRGGWGPVGCKCQEDFPAKDRR